MLVHKQTLLAAIYTHFPGMKLDELRGLNEVNLPTTGLQFFISGKIQPIPFSPQS